MIRKNLKKLIISTFVLCFCFIYFYQAFATEEYEPFTDETIQELKEADQIIAEDMKYIDMFISAENNIICVKNYTRTVRKKAYDFNKLISYVLYKRYVNIYNLTVKTLRELYRRVKNECDKIARTSPELPYVLAALNMLEQIAIENDFELVQFSTVGEEENNSYLSADSRTFLSQMDKIIEISSYIRKLNGESLGFISFWNFVCGKFNTLDPSFFDQEDIYFVNIDYIRYLYDVANRLLGSKTLAQDKLRIVRLAKNMAEQIAIENNFALTAC